VIASQRIEFDVSPAASESESELVARTVDLFCQRSLGPLCARAELTMSEADLLRLTVQAEQVGILNVEQEPGLGLWENADDEAGRVASVTTLGKIARVNAGVAYHWHMLGLGQWLARHLSLCSAQRVIPCLQGSWGMGRASLARLLLSRPLVEEDIAILSDYFVATAERPLMFQAGSGWENLLVPRFSVKHSELSIELWPRSALELELVPGSHGLDETATHCFWPALQARGVTVSALPAPQVHELYASALCLNALGLLAIGAGALQHALGNAVSYAQVRVQGGIAISAHAAVQELLGNVASVEQLVSVALAGLCRRQPCVAQLSAVFGARAQLQPLLCTAANDALQVFGGLGYMRDAGVEKLVRDQNCLRVMHGTSSELRRFVAVMSLGPSNG